MVARTADATSSAFDPGSWNAATTPAGRPLNAPTWA